MDVLKSVLLESKKHYADLEKRIEKDLKSLPSGGVKQRRIAGSIYYYLQGGAQVFGQREAGGIAQADSSTTCAQG